MFKKAVKEQCKLRLLLQGASGSGKTYSALILATSMTPGKVALIDTEHYSASLYSNEFDFDTCAIEGSFDPAKYIEAIEEAEQAGYSTIIIDSLSHAWSGKGGCLDKQTQLGGRYQDWAKVTPLHRALVDKILTSSCHIISTVRAKAAYALDTSGNNKLKVTKLGMKAEQRDGLDFEFTSVLKLDENNIASSDKDRTGIFIGKYEKITPTTAVKLLDWLSDGPSEEQIREEIVSNLKKAAKGGTDKLRNAFSNLSNKEKKLILDQMDGLKEEAKKGGK